MDEKSLQYAQNADQFYRGQVFGMFKESLERIERNSEDAHKRLESKMDLCMTELNTLKGNLKYIYGFAAALSFILTFIWEWVKNRFQ